jgi:hypothetical protein
MGKPQNKVSERSQARKYCMLPDSIYTEVWEMKNTLQ